MPTTYLSIRPIALSDYAGWLPLWQGYLEFYQTTLSDAQTVLTWQRILDTTHPLQGLVAEREDQLLGFAHFFMHGSTWSPHGYCYLEDLFVSEAARGRGLARQLIELALPGQKTKAQTSCIGSHKRTTTPHACSMTALPNALASSITIETVKSAS